MCNSTREVAADAAVATAEETMMTDPVTATVRGVQLVLMKKQWPGEPGPDLWKPSDFNWKGPQEPRPISEWEDVIKKWEIACQIEAGFEVWHIGDDRPKYWGKLPAVFRSGGPVDEKGYGYNRTRMVHARNGSDPGSLYGIEQGKCAPVTPEVEAAIEKARELHAIAVEAGKAWKKAWEAIPRLSVDEWAKLPEKPGRNW
jgi:hypothetical protein